MVLGIGGPPERPEVVVRTMSRVRRAGVVPTEDLLLAVPVLVRGGRVSLRRVALPSVAVVVMVTGFLVGRRVGETDPGTGIALVGLSLLAGGVAVAWLLVDGLREVRRFTRQLGGAADLVDPGGSPVLALTDGVLWLLAGRGAELRVTGRVPVDDIARVTLGVTPTPSIDVRLRDGSYLALRAAFVDHAHWLREASQPWRDAVADAVATRADADDRGGTVGEGADRGGGAGGGHDGDG